MSIHKSQGLTLDGVALSLRDCFETGHAYVALSRATSLEGAHLLSFEPKCVQAHPAVLGFYRALEGPQPDDDAATAAAAAGQPRAPLSAPPLLSGCTRAPPRPNLDSAAAGATSAAGTAAVAGAAAAATPVVLSDEQQARILASKAAAQSRRVAAEAAARELAEQEAEEEAAAAAAAAKAEAAVAAEATAAAVVAAAAAEVAAEAAAAAAAVAAAAAAKTAAAAAKVAAVERAANEAILAALAEKRAAKQRKGAAGAGVVEAAGAAAPTLEVATSAKAKRKALGIHADATSHSGTPDSCEPISSGELARAGLDGWTRKLSKTSGKPYYASPGKQNCAPRLCRACPAECTATPCWMHARNATPQALMHVWCAATVLAAAQMARRRFGSGRRVSDVHELHTHRLDARSAAVLWQGSRSRISPRVVMRSF